MGLVNFDWPQRSVIWVIIADLGYGSHVHNTGRGARAVVFGATVAPVLGNWRLAIVVKLFNFLHLARNRQVPLAAFGLAAALLVCPAFAAESDTLKLVLSDTFSYNSNLLRTP